MADPKSPTTGGPRRARKLLPFHLFVYGTLRNPAVFRAVLGLRLAAREAEADGVESFHPREAVLPGYKKTSPDDTYLYAVPEPQGRINGYVIGPLPGSCLISLRRYEGRNYRQVRREVQTADGPVRAVAFVGNTDELSHSFGWAFHDRLKQEVLLRGKIEKVLQADEIERLHTHEELTRRALQELHGRTIRDLIRRHFDAGGISNFAIEQAIRDEPLPDFTDVAGDPAVAGLAPAYLSLLVRQVIFNQMEGRIRDEFRYELDQMGVSDRFYERTISSLAALRVLNAQRGLMHLLAGDVLADLSFEEHRLIDFVRWAITAADRIYDAARAESELVYISHHMSPGAIPLGAELEFSNIGHGVILDPTDSRHRDRHYDGFLYFRDFALDILTWKLGGHVDDHRVKSSATRRRGFFELALGSLSVEANISKPITDDPWLLNQIVHAGREFYDIGPHSLHISFQLRSVNRPVEDRPLPVAAMKCLLALAGDPRVDEAGGVRISRMGGQEILGNKPAAYLLFSQISRRRSADDEADVAVARGRWVQQFKFPRLAERINYEPIIVALKGLQIHYKPGSFLTGKQFRDNPELVEPFLELTRWGAAAEPLPARDIEEFLSAVHDGLMHEHRGRPAHSSAYIAYCLTRLRAGLDEFNGLFPGKVAPE